MNTARNTTTVTASLPSNHTHDESPPVTTGLREGQAVRRTFTAEYKRRVLAEYDAAPHGQKGAVLRREKLYDTQITEWRGQAVAGTLAGTQKKTGRPTATVEQKRVRELEQQLTRAQTELTRKDQVIADRDAALEVLGKGVAFLDALSKNTTR